MVVGSALRYLKKQFENSGSNVFKCLLPAACCLLIKGAECRRDYIHLLSAVTALLVGPAFFVSDECRCEYMGNSRFDSCHLRQVWG